MAGEPPAAAAAGETRPAYRVCRRRWLMLALYVLFGAVVAGQWVEYSIVANVVARYYAVSAFAVDCTSMVFMLFYGLLAFPVIYLSERAGLRWSLLAGSGLCCLGAWLKLLSTTRDGFATTLLGQSVVAVSLVVMMPLPGRLAANWFGSEELSTATSLGLFGPQLGVAASFLLPPMLVRNHPVVEDIGPDLASMFRWVAAVSTASLVLLAIFFEEEPRLPPNETRALQKRLAADKADQAGEFGLAMRRLLANRSFVVLCHSYGLNVGILNALSTLLNRMYLLHFAHGEEDAGRIGLLLILAGMLGSVTFGVVLDRTHKFKETAVAVYLLTLCGQVLFAAAMFAEVAWMVYAAGAFLGFFMSGYLALGYELAAEYTYPESEALSAGVLNIANNLYGIAMILGLEQLMDYLEGDLPAHLLFCATLLVGLVMTVLTKDEQRRQDARKAAADAYRNLPQEDARNDHPADVAQA